MEQPNQKPSRYAFIFNADKKSSFKLPSLNLPRPVAVGMLVTFIVMLLFLVLLLLTNKSSPLLQVAAHQKEIASLSVTAVGSARSQNVKDLASTIDAVFSTEQSQTAKAIGISPASKKLNIYNTKSLNNQLQTATDNGTFDQTYLQILKSQLNTYSQSLLAASKKLATNSPKQALLTADYNEAQILLGDPAFKGM